MLILFSVLCDVLFINPTVYSTDGYDDVIRFLKIDLNLLVICLSGKNVK